MKRFVYSDSELFCISNSLTDIFDIVTNINKYSICPGLFTLKCQI